MLFSIGFRGGAYLIMMGQQTRSESLFYYFRLEDHIPEIICCDLLTATLISLSFARH